jgi:two-component system phosphate regulon sensor histidine kinase PhoR
LEVVRDHRIDALATRARETGLEQAAELELAGSRRRLAVRAVPLPAARTLVLCQDVSRVRYLETVRQQFVANLAHDMRTPLSGLALAAQTLARELPADGDARMLVGRVLEESQRLQAMLRNLTQLAALDAEGVKVERVVFGVAQMLKNLAERNQFGAQRRALELRIDEQTQGLAAIGDRAKTEQALQNVIDNALKFTEQGSIELAAASRDGKAEIAVRDTGPGIPPRDLPRIFERFYKVDRSRGGVPGSGLGLSIARHLIELQGGTITAESEPGEGTTIRIRLPEPP